MIYMFHPDAEQLTRYVTGWPVAYPDGWFRSRTV